MKAGDTIAEMLCDINNKDKDNSLNINSFNKYDKRQKDVESHECARPEGKQRIEEDNNNKNGGISLNVNNLNK